MQYHVYVIVHYLITLIMYNTIPVKRVVITTASANSVLDIVERKYTDICMYYRLQSS